MKIILIAGALANKPNNGGGVWERMSWLLGLQQLGFEVQFIEQLAPEVCSDVIGNATPWESSHNLAWFRDMTNCFGIADRATLVKTGSEETVGRTWSELLALAQDSTLLINLSGHLTRSELLRRIRCKVYVDVDPGFTQFWLADPQSGFRLEGHDHYYTIGENIGSPGCDIPTAGIHWRATRQPLVLHQWPVVLSPKCDRFTTIASWRGSYGPVHAAGKPYGLKVHEFRKFKELPQRLATPVEIALDIHPNDERDRLALLEHGWHLADPKSVAATADSFRSYIQKSAAELTVAQGIYVDTNSGWFSDRTVRYLSSGKPALVQDTGFTQRIPVGQGLLSFRTFEEAVQGAERIAADYETHCQAAREIAVRYFHSDKVLGKLLDEVGVQP